MIFASNPLVHTGFVRGIDEEVDMKMLIVFVGTAVILSSTPVFAGGDYENPWTDPSATSPQRNDETVYMPPSRRVTGEEVDHHKAPIYFYAPEN